MKRPFLLSGPNSQLATVSSRLSIVHISPSHTDRDPTVNCRSMLWSQLNVLSDRVANLHRAASATSWAIVDLADATSVCEDVRRASLHALSDQYQRILAGRPLAKSLSVVRPRIQSTVSAQSDESLRPSMLSRQPSDSLRPPRYQIKQYRLSQQQQKPQPYQQQHHAQPRQHHPSPPPPTEHDQEAEDEKILRAYIGGPLRIQQNEPPSPPLTPKTSVSGSDSSSTVASRPGNSVFAQFCGEAMALQVDTKKPVPASGNCACGYEWQAQLNGRRGASQLKEGFKLTTRYLAKSHVESNGFGCVLCTSTGKSEKFEGVEMLKEHINASHTKWQLLHDTDCRASSKLADGFW